MAFEVSGFGTPNYQVNTVAGTPVKLDNGMTNLNEILDYQGKNIELAKKRALLVPDIQKGQAESQKAVTGAESSAIDLATKKQAAIGTGYVAQIFNPLVVKAATNPDAMTPQERKKLVSETERWGIQQGKEAGIDEATALRLTQPYIDIAQKNPEQLQDYLKSRHIVGLTPAEQGNALRPSGVGVNTGAGGYVANTNPFAGQVGQVIPGTQYNAQLGPSTEAVAQPGDGSGLPPGTKYYIGAGNQPVPQIPGAQAPMAPQAPVGVTPAQMNAPANAQQQGRVVSSLGPSTGANLEVGTALVNSARQAGSLVPTGIFNANQIIKLADKTNVGQGSQIIASLQGQNAFVPSGTWTASASDYNQLGHYLAQQTALLAKNPAVGGVLSNTVAGQQLAGQLAGTQEWTEGAIKNTSRVNRALLDATGLYNKGVQKSQQISNNNPIKANEFQDKWNDILDINSVRLIDAIKNKDADPEGFREVVKELGGAKSPVFQRALKQVDEINNLVSKGQ